MTTQDLFEMECGAFAVASIAVLIAIADRVRRSLQVRRLRKEADQADAWIEATTQARSQPPAERGLKGAR